nr:vacuolar atpase assembly integral membrane protein vma21 [Quercus suber]
MTTRRITTQEKTVLDQDETTQDGKSNISPAVPPAVIVKLLAFTGAMVVVPIGSYFLTVQTIFRGNATYAGALAALMANVVLIGYVIVAFWDDQSEREADEAERKKAL